jgi:hypothetical protein
LRGGRGERQRGNGGKHEAKGKGMKPPHGCSPFQQIAADSILQRCYA